MGKIKKTILACFFLAGSLWFFLSGFMPTGVNCQRDYSSLNCSVKQMEIFAPYEKKIDDVVDTGYSVTRVRRSLFSTCEIFLKNSQAQEISFSKHVFPSAYCGNEAEEIKKMLNNKDSFSIIWRDNYSIMSGALLLIGAFFTWYKVF